MEALRRRMDRATAAAADGAPSVWLTAICALFLDTLGARDSGRILLAGIGIKPRADGAATVLGTQEGTEHTGILVCVARCLVNDRGVLAQCVGDGIVPHSC